MKRKIALLLALVMVISMLPMNTFGRQPGVINQRSHPHGVWDIDATGPFVGRQFHTFAIDAAWLANQPVPAGGFLTLQLETLGGPSTGGNMVGMVGRHGQDLNLQTDTAAAASGTPSTTVSFRPGVGFTIKTTPTAITAANINGLDANVGRAAGHVTWAGSRHSLAVDRHGTRDESRLWSRGIFDLNAAGLTIPSLTPGVQAAIVDMEGWINVTVPIQAGDAEASFRITLVRTSAQGVAQTVATLLDGGIVASGRSGGVSITSRGIVPLVGGRVRLQPIRITEQRNGLLEGRQHTVRLVAPRGFRWDTGAMPGLTAQALTAVGNPVTFSHLPNNSVLLQLANPDDLIQVTNPNGPGRSFSWMNTVSDREELYIRINVPNRAGTPAALGERIWVDLYGLSLIALPSAPRTGTASIDVYVGAPSDSDAANNMEWQIPGAAGNTFVATMNNDRFDDLRNLGDTRLVATTEGNPTGRVLMRPLFGKRVESHAINDWRHYGLAVASLDEVGLITVTGPDEGPFEAMSGRTTAEIVAINGNPGTANSNVTWVHGENHTIRLTENFTGAMFRSYDIYELRPANEGAKIIDMRVRVGHATRRDVNVAWDRPEHNNEDFLSANTSFEDGSVFFAPRTLDPMDPDFNEPDEVRSMDISLTMSIEAGYVATYDTEDVQIQVFRNNEYLDTVTVGKITDPIVVTTQAPEVIFRNQFDVLPLTPVASFTISETEGGMLESGDELWIGLQAIQNGRIVNINLGNMNISVDAPIVNEEASGFAVREIPGSNGLGWRVQRPSNEGATAGTLSFNGVYLSGPSVPNVEWRVIIHGPEITENHLLPGQVPEANTVPATPNANALWMGYVTNSANTTTADFRFLERAVFHALPYSAPLLVVQGESDIDHRNLHAGPGRGGRASFTANTMVEVDGVTIQAAAFPTVAPGIVSSMMNPRVFAQFMGVSGDWDASAETFTFTGPNAMGASTTVTLTLNSPNVSINGQSFDIATHANQPSLAGQIRPQVINGRQYVPARILANAFGIPIEFSAGTVTLG